MLLGSHEGQVLPLSFHPPPLLLASYFSCSFLHPISSAKLLQPTFNCINNLSIYLANFTCPVSGSKARGSCPLRKKAYFEVWTTASFGYSGLGQGEGTGNILIPSVTLPSPSLVALLSRAGWSVNKIYGSNNSRHIICSRLGEIYFISTWCVGIQCRYMVALI